MSLSLCTMKTPLGDMQAFFTAQGLCMLEFAEPGKRVAHEQAQIEAVHGPARASGHPLADQLRSELDAYFTGKLQEFSLPLDFVGTEFQKQVWRALLEIPYGTTWSYGQQAAFIGRPKASRAVAAANGQNKISIVVPCHRVIGSNGKLTGYGGGLPRKRWLLELEASGEAPQIPFSWQD